MATRRTAPASTPFIGVDALEHADDKRRNLPTAEYQSLIEGCRRVGAVAARIDGLVQAVSIHHPRHHAQHGTVLQAAGRNAGRSCSELKAFSLAGGGWAMGAIRSRGIGNRFLTE